MKWLIYRLLNRGLNRFGFVVVPKRELTAIDRETGSAEYGVGGGIVAVVPGRLGIGVFSPLLDARGNSVRGIRVCTDLSERFGLHVFESSPAAHSMAEAMTGRARATTLRP